MAGQTSHRASITGITNAKPCAVTTSEEHGYSTYDFVRLTDLNGCMPTVRGMNPINNYRYRIIVTTTTEFTLQDPITFDAIDSTDYPPYVEGGYCNRIETDFYYYGD